MPANKNILYDFLMLQKYSVWRHALFIVVLIPIGLSQAFFALGSSEEIPTRTIYYFGMGFSTITMAIVYLNNYCLAPRFLSKGQYANYFTLLLAVVSGFVIVRSVAQYHIFSSAGIRKEFNGVTVLDGLSNLTIYTICIVSGSITSLLKQWTADHATIEELKNKQLKNSIDELKSRIQPKFLYATLDYAAEKVKSEPEQTSDTLFKLSELLKYQLYDAARNKVLLASDIEFIRHYLVLERQNSGNRFAFTLTITGDVHQFIPPALFTPWIEEITSQHPEELSLKFDIQNGLIVFTCVVKGADLSACDFRSAEQKLALLYGHDGVVQKTNDSIALQLNYGK